MLLVVLLAVNYWAASRVTHENPRVRVPYSPFFIAQVNAGDVKQINSRGTTIQGTFRRKLRYPPTDKKAELTDRFKTEVPTFANTDQLSALLQARTWWSTPKPPDQGPSLLGQLLLGFGPDDPDRRPLRAGSRARGRRGRAAALVSLRPLARAARRGRASSA